MNDVKSSNFRKPVLTLAVASCLAFAAGGALAASLGKLTVLSGLGQPLRAEIELGATPEELAGMNARIAPREVFKQNGVDYQTALNEVSLIVEKRPNGRSLVRVMSLRPINEPFLDLLVELDWPAGRLVREYTFLLDPADIAARQSAPQSAEAQVVETVASPPPVAAKPVARPSPEAAKPAAAPEKPAAGSHLVKRGETLRGIAEANANEGVSLEQMLIGLYRTNPDAFLGKNINRLKAGAILELPDPAVAAAIPPDEAKRVYATHARDWHSYRQKLAAASAQGAAKDDAAGQSSSGKITARVDEKTPPAEAAKDQVKVARTDLPGPTPAAADAERVAAGKALQEAQERVALLEKQVGDLQKLLEMKNQRLAEAQQAQEKPAEAPAKPVEPPPAPPVEPPAPPPAPKASFPPPPPPPEPESHLLDDLLADPLPLAAGGGAALLLVALLLQRRRARQAQPEPLPYSTVSQEPSQRSGGRSVDTGAATAPPTADFSQAGPGTIDTDDVDPVAEAEVYMAYGRDAQAEEILLEALQKEGQRPAIHAKLLEIYAKRGSVKQFEALAGELHAQTGGQGEDWRRAAALGHQLDPGNPLYAPPVAAAPAVMPLTEAEAPASAPVAAAEPAPVDEALPYVAPEMPAPAVADLPPAGGAVIDTAAVPSPDEFAQLIEEIEVHPVAEPENPDQAMSLDFDLAGMDELAPAAPPAEAPPEAAPEAAPAPYAGDLEAFEFDLAPIESPVSELAAPPAAEPESAVPELAEEVEAAEVVEDSAPPPVEAPAPPVFDFDLNLETPADEPPPPIFDSADLLRAPPPLAPVPDAGADEEHLGDAAAHLASVLAKGPGRDAFITSIDLDLGAPPAAADEASAELADDVPELAELGDFAAAPASLPEEAAELPAAEPAPPAEPVRDAHWEEVNTKLDLAKAYEEMGDLEGARELLQEVIGEGASDLVEQAEAILARVSG